jgi:MerR family mercuric resistance operon transcriptional regulator
MAMTIGQVATGAGVNVQTVRYYERRGLLPETPRTSTGPRKQV